MSSREHQLSKAAADSDGPRRASNGTPRERPPHDRQGGDSPGPRRASGGAPRERQGADTDGPRRASNGTPLAWWKWTAGILMVYVTYGAFFLAQGAVSFGKGGNVARIVFFHVPVAVLTYVCYVAAFVHAVRYLKRRQPGNDIASSVNMEIGFVFCILATITGALFAGLQWGQFWNWDPREISILIMLALYASYLLLRAAAADQPETRGRLSAVYAIVMLVPATFLIWVVPRIPALMSLHPTDTLVRPHNTSASYKEVLYPSFVAFTMLWSWLFDLRYRLCRLEARMRARRESMRGETIANRAAVTPTATTAARPR